MRVLLLITAAVSALVAVGLGIGLSHSRRDDDEPWARSDYLCAIGIAVGLLTAMLSALAAHNVDPEDSAEVKAYRQEVRATCTSLNAGQGIDPIGAAMQGDPDRMDRDALAQGFAAQLDGARAILASLWDRTAPRELAADVRDAKEAADRDLELETAKLENLPQELPNPFTMEQLSAYANTFAAIQGAVAHTNATMSRLAGQTCRTTAA
jgi:hypothetical protein